MRVLIVGGGKAGAHLASLLMAEHHQVKLIEIKSKEARRLYEDVPMDSVISGNGTDPAILEAGGIREAQVLAAMTGSDETNLVVTSLARFEFAVPRTIARVKDPKNAWMFTPAMGVDVAVSQSDFMAHLIAEEMSLGNMMTLLKLHKGQYSLVEEQVHPEADAAGRRIQDLPFPDKCILVAVIRKGDLIIPHGGTVLLPADEVLALVHASQTSELSSLLEN